MGAVVLVAGSGGDALPLAVRVFLAALTVAVLVFVVVFTISTRGRDE